MDQQDGRTGLVVVVKTTCLGEWTPKSNSGPPGWGLGHRANSSIPVKKTMLKNLRQASVIGINGFYDKK